jgi:DNA topoisomerase-2
MCFDELGAMTKFEHVNDILHKFYALRVIYYSKRKDYLMGMLGAEARKLSNQAR